MRPSFVFRAAHARTPLIKFLGKRQYPKNIDHSPQPHPASPTHQLPESFASYRQKVQNHGPLGGQQNGNGSPAPRPSAGGPTTYGAIGGHSAKQLGSIQPQDGEYFDISELPKRFHRLPYTEQEMEAVTSGGASLW